MEDRTQVASLILAGIVAKDRAIGDPKGSAPEPSWADALLAALDPSLVEGGKPIP
jgi:hypothetical protein